MATGLAPRSVARTVACVRGFYRFLTIDGHIVTNPGEDLQGPRSWPALPRSLSMAEVDALIQQPDTETVVGVRDRALVELLYATGMRVSELVSLRPADLNLKSAYLVCMGKGSKERFVPIGSSAVDWVDRYWTARTAGLAADADVAVALCQRAGRDGPQPRGVLEETEEIRASGRVTARPESSHAAALLRDPSPRAWCRPALDPDIAGACRHLDDPDLHPHLGGAIESGLRRVSPPFVIDRVDKACYGPRLEFVSKRLNYSEPEGRGV